MITGYVNGQTLKLSAPPIVAGSVNYLEAVFLFRQREWDDMDVIRAVFSLAGTEYSIQLDDGRILPSSHLDLTVGTWAVHLVGSSYDGEELLQRITTQPAELVVLPTGGTGGNPLPQMPASDVERLEGRIESNTKRIARIEEVGVQGVGAIICTAVGDTIVLSDAATQPIQGLRLFGKSTQAGTATPDAPLPVASAGDGGEIVVIVAEGGGQSLAVPAPNGLPGVPVPSGGNYTDDSGQQWICDELDLNRGIYVRRVGVDVYSDAGAFEDRSATKKHVYSFNTSEYRPAGNVRAVCSYGYRGSVGAIEQSDSKGAGVSVYFKSGSRSKLCYLYDPSCASLGDLQAKLSAAPMVMVYNLAEPVEIQLTDTADYHNLHTIKAGTTIYTDSGAGVEVRYAVDTKAYIDGLVGDIGALLDRI